MRNTIITVAAIAFVGVAATGAWLWKSGRLRLPAELERAAEEAIGTVQQAAEQISAPPPLRGPLEPRASALTRSGVLASSNFHRTEVGLPALSFNAELNAAAEAKLADMFAGQYFEHLSPSGAGPGDLADAAGYAYVAVGENLALGNYKDDDELVQAWMDSPEHRANILGARFTEIGVAVGRGTFEGTTTWLAVQEFGLPLSACPQPSVALKDAIAGDQARLAAFKTEADALKAEIDAGRKPRSQAEADAYNAKVDRYNALARDINALIAAIQGQVTEYNGQVQAFNACAQN